MTETECITEATVVVMERHACVFKLGYSPRVLSFRSDREKLMASIPSLASVMGASNEYGRQIQALADKYHMIPVTQTDSYAKDGSGRRSVTLKFDCPTDLFDNDEMRRAHFAKFEEEMIMLGHRHFFGSNNEHVLVGEGGHRHFIATRPLEE